MKSRILAVLFAAMLAAGTLVGCGSKAAEDAETKTEDTKEDTNDAENDKDTSEAEPTVTPKMATEEEAEAAGFTDASENDDAIVVLDTSRELTGIHHADISIRDYGDIQVELDADTAPVTVTNFVKLVQGKLMFQEFLALKDVSFEVKKGESWGLIGTNGSGKSTMLKLISGILKPYKGTVTVNGSIAPLIELGAGFDGELTARENIFLNGAVLGYSHKFMEEHFDEIVDFAELRDFLDMPIKNYSSGMSARLGFAVATVVRPDILICDEVLAVGDYAFQQKCEKRMTDMREAGTTLLYVSHNMESVKKVCDKALWLNKGIVKEVGFVDEIAEKYMMFEKE